MITIDAARKIGVNACIDKIGREFVLLHRASSTASYSTDVDEDGNVFCFVGVDYDHQRPEQKPNVLTLDNESKFPYWASCNVKISDGSTQFVGFVLPQ